jgi:hypothetical protein
MLRMKETRSLVLIAWRFLAFFGINDFLVNLKASFDPPAASAAAIAYMLSWLARQM